MRTSFLPLGHISNQTMSSYLDDLNLYAQMYMIALNNLKSLKSYSLQLK